MVKIRINKDNCIGCGLCASLCPKIFKVTDKAELKKTELKDQKEIDCADQAAESCPVSAIEIK